MHLHVKGISLFLLIGATSAQSQPLSLLLAREFSSFLATEQQPVASSQQAAPTVLPEPKEQASGWGAVDFSKAQVVLKKGSAIGSVKPAKDEIALQSVVRMALARHPSIADAIATLDQEDAGIDVAKSDVAPVLWSS